MCARASPRCACAEPQILMLSAWTRWCARRGVRVGRLGGAFVFVAACLFCARYCAAAAVVARGFGDRAGCLGARDEARAGSSTLLCPLLGAWTGLHLRAASPCLLRVGPVAAGRPSAPCARAPFRALAVVVRQRGRLSPNLSSLEVPGRFANYRWGDPTDVDRAAGGHFKRRPPDRL